MFRIIQSAAFAFMAGCATNPSQVVSPRCDLFENCFDRDRVRTFEVLDRNTIIVEVGPYRCPFLVEVDGFDCQLPLVGRLAFYDDDRRICSLDGAYLVTDVFSPVFPQDSCRVRDVRAVSEDELLERYATSGRIPPPPPTGAGELQVEEGTEATDPAAGPVEDSSDAESTVEAQETSWRRQQAPWQSETLVDP